MSRELEQHWAACAAGSIRANCLDLSLEKLSTEKFVHEGTLCMRAGSF